MERGLQQQKDLAKASTSTQGETRDKSVLRAALLARATPLAADSPVLEDKQNSFAYQEIITRRQYSAAGALTGRRQSLSENALNERAFYSDSPQAYTYFGASASREDGVDLQVRDTRRGFQNSTRFTGAAEASGQHKVIVIEEGDVLPDAPATPAP